MDDHVSKLEHMGKETVKKLQDIHASAIGCGIDIDVPTNCVNKGDSRGASKGLLAPWQQHKPSNNGHPAQAPPVEPIHSMGASRLCST